MRRRLVWPDEPPELLKRFDPVDWPAAGAEEAFALWRDARRAFFDVHGWRGGAVALIHEQRAERLRHFHGAGTTRESPDRRA